MYLSQITGDLSTVLLAFILVLRPMSFAYFGCSTTHIAVPQDGSLTSYTSILQSSKALFFQLVVILSGHSEIICLQKKPQKTREETRGNTCEPR